MTGLGETSAYGRSEAWLTRHNVSFPPLGPAAHQRLALAGPMGSERLCAFLASAVQVVKQVAEHGLIW
jgi:hypothetical protein